MKKLSIKNIIEFRRKSVRGKKTLINNLKASIKPNLGGGGDYWISSTSALSNAFKKNDNQIIKDKIDHLLNEYELRPHKTTKDMYNRNIGILQNYEDFDFSNWQPSKDLIFLPKPRDRSILSIKGLPVQALPSHVFTFDKKGVPSIGAIWFVAKLSGYTKEELGMFSEILYRYLKNNFSKDYDLEPKYCIAVDVVNNFDVNYSQIQKAEIPAILNATIDEINRFV